MNTPRIGFERINAVALSSLESLLSRWLPGGKVNGSEFVCGSLEGEAGRSLSINLHTGVWKDFAGDVGGADPVSLYAAIHNLKQGEAARKLAGELGLDAGGSGPHGKGTSTPVDLLGKRKTDSWRAMFDVPGHAPTPPDAFRRKDEGQWITSALAGRWTYKGSQGGTLFHACRFEHPDGSKEIIPQTYCYTLDGKEDWRWKSYPEPRPLYGLDLLAAAKAEAPVLLVEGEKTADAAGRLLPGAVCMTWPGGCKAVGKADFKPLAGRHVAIWPDADKPGFEAALSLAVRVREAGAVEVSVIAAPDGVADGWDLADAEAESWSPERVKEHINAHKLDVAAFEALARERYGIEVKAPDKRSGSTASGWFPFKLKADGVYFEDGDDATWLCSPLSVLAMTRDGEGREWGRLVEVVDSDGTPHRWAMPMSAMAGDGQEYRRELLSMGLRLASGKGPKRLHDYLTLSKPEGRARCVSRVGWHGRRFVLPDAVYGPHDGGEVILQGGPADHAFRAAGSLQDWQENIGRYCPGNSRLVFAVSAALAAPLLALAGAESGGFHFVGGSSTGKTTALRVAGSVCGGGGLNGYLRQWRATGNALESVSSGACDCLLALDELGQADAKTAGAVAYMLTNGQGKARSKRDGTARKPQEWRVLFLSTGEITLADKIGEDGKSRVKAGQLVRVADIQADAGAGLGVFENIHHFESAVAFASHLNDQAKNVYGSPLRVFLEKLTADTEGASQSVPVMVGRFVEEVRPSGADGQVSRVASRFGLVAAAGELGIALGVLPWPAGESLSAAARCFQDWLDARGGASAAEVTAGLAQVRQFFQAHGAARFETWGEAADVSKIVNRAGFRRQDEDTGEWSFYVFQDVFKAQVCQGHNPDMVLRELKGRGLLLTQEAKGLTVKPRIPGVGSGTRFYHVAPAILAEPEKTPALQKQAGTSRGARPGPLSLQSVAASQPNTTCSCSGMSGSPQMVRGRPGNSLWRGFLTC